MKLSIKTILLLWFFGSNLNFLLAQTYLFHFDNEGKLYKKEIKNDNLTPFQITGDNTACIGESITLSTSIKKVVQWSNLESNTEITIHPNINSWFYASYTNEFGCSYVDSIYINVYDLPDKPIIVQQGEDLVVNNVSGSFQWYFNENSVAGAVSNIIHPENNGNYYVVNTDSHGCQNTSDIFIYEGSSVKDKITEKISIYPNPTSGIIFIHINSQIGSFILKIYNFEGKELTNVPLCNSSSYTIDFLEKYPAGIYLFKIYDNNNNSTLFAISKI